MAVRLPTATRNAAADAVADRTDLGTTETEGKLRIYSGTQPASANDAPSGTLLAEVDLAQPAFSGASNGVVTLLGVPLGTTGITDGTAGWARVVDRDAATVIDLSATATGGGGQVQLNTTTISTGVAVSVTAGTITMPSGE